MKMSHWSAAIVVSAAVSAGAQAEVQQFILEWSGASFENSATASGLISIDMDLLLNPGHNNLIDNPGYVTDFTITVTGSTSGDGTWDLEDYDNIILDTDYGPDGGEPERGGGGGMAFTALDFSRDLVGQMTSLDPWGTSQPGATGGDFNIFPNQPGAPDGSYYFEITVGGFSGPMGETGPGGPPIGEQLLLTSFRPVPTPGAVALAGIAGMSLVRRRR